MTNEAKPPIETVAQHTDDKPGRPYLEVLDELHGEPGNGIRRLAGLAIEPIIVPTEL